VIKWKPILEPYIPGSNLVLLHEIYRALLDHSYSVKIRKEGADKMICRTSGFQVKSYKGLKSRGWGEGSKNSAT